tara:strand:- start:164 stop:343 length:180 start_codon:yes stop_codon:yes gene_type:complete
MDSLSKIQGAPIERQNKFLLSPINLCISAVFIFSVIIYGTLLVLRISSKVNLLVIISLA